MIDTQSGRAGQSVFRTPFASVTSVTVGGVSAPFTFTPGRVTLNTPLAEGASVIIDGDFLPTTVLAGGASAASYSNPKVRFVATKGKTPTGARAQGANGDCGETAMLVQLAAAAKDLRVLQQNWNIVSNGASPYEQDNAASVTYETFLERGHRQGSVQVTYGGQAVSAAVAGGSDLVSDATSLTGDKSGRLFIRNRAIVGVGGSLPWAQNLSRADEYQHHFPSANGKVCDQLGVSARPGATGTSYGVTQASALLGVALEPIRSILFQGHSICDGSNSTTVTDGGIGYVAYGSTDDDGSILYAYMRSTCGGDMIANMANAARNTRRKRLYQYADYLIIDAIVNDIATRSVQNILDDIEAVATLAKADGVKKVGVVLCAPKCTGTFPAGTSQTPVSGFEVGGKRDQVNAALWTRAFNKTNGIDFVVNFNGTYSGEGTATIGTLTASGLESHTTPGTWGANMSTDGTHPSDGGHFSVMAPRLRAAVKANCPAI